ncbi:MAG: arsenical pump-driving ATPase [bacterium]
MNFIEQAPAYLFFTGKGGVGKTSLACATAVRLVDEGNRVLLVSTDPASNVGQVFGIEIGHRVTPIDTVPGLSALEIDPPAAAQAYRERIVGPVRGVLPDGIVKGIEEQLSGACTTEIAAFDEFTSLLTDSELTAQFDHIVFDTAPTGHTIRLLQLPGAWSGFLEQGAGDASCLGPLAGLEKQRAQYRAAVDALADPARTRLVLVAARAARDAPGGGTHPGRACRDRARPTVPGINGILPAPEGKDDPLATAIVAREGAALDELPDALSALPRDTVPSQGHQRGGVGSVARAPRSHGVGHASPAPRRPAHDVRAAARRTHRRHRGAGPPGNGDGQGGVGKTTLAAAVAVELARRGHAVHLTTSDPAAHLSDMLDGTLDSLELSRIDPHAETERYRSDVLAAKGAKLDAQGRALLEEDLRSPCTEEIAVFQAFSKVIREAGKRFVVMDTAPTGHTLLLLDATGAYHRETARQMGSSGLNFTTPMMLLQDPRRTKILIVTLAETTPVLEAASLQADLRRAGIEPWAWIVNSSLAVAETRSPLLRQRAAEEVAQIAAVATRHSSRYAVIPLLAEEPVGIARLIKLVHPVSEWCR